MRRGIILLGLIAIVSIALNLFQAGDQIGRHFRGHVVVQPNFERRMQGLFRDMPADDQPVAQRIFDRHYDDIIAKWRAYRPANQRLSDTIQADPFDPADAKAAYDTANQRWVELRAAMRDTLIEISENVSPEGRKRLHGLGMNP